MLLPERPIQISRISDHISLCNLSPFWLYWTNFVAFSGIRCWFTLMLCFINNIKSNIQSPSCIICGLNERTRYKRTSLPPSPTLRSHSHHVLFPFKFYPLRLFFIHFMMFIECAERQNMKKNISFQQTNISFFLCFWFLLGTFAFISCSTMLLWFAADYWCIRIENENLWSQHYNLLDSLHKSFETLKINPECCTHSTPHSSVTHFLVERKAKAINH